MPSPRDERSEPDRSRVGAGLAGRRVGWVPFSHEPHVASARLRSFIPCAALRRVGVDAVIVPPDLSGDYDCVVFQKAYRPEHVEFAARLADRGVPIVFDLCDNHFFVPDEAPELAPRADRLRELIGMADVVSVSVPALADLVTAEVGPQQVLLVDDAMEEPVVSAWARRSAERRHRDPTGRLRLVWFGHAGHRGTPAGLAHLASLVPELERLDAQRPIRLTVISDSEATFRTHLGGARFRTRYVRWTANGFGRRFVGNDVCLIPIEINPVTWYKTNNRVRTSLLLGVPVVATQIPSYAEFAPWIRFEDWSRHILGYLADPVSTRSTVRAAAAHIRAVYTEDRLVAQWAAVLGAAVGASG